MVETFDISKINPKNTGLSPKATKALRYLVHKLLEENEDSSNDLCNTTVKVTASEIYKLLNYFDKDRIIFDIEKSLDLSVQIDEDDYSDYISNEINMIQEHFTESILTELFNYQLKVYEGSLTKLITAIHSIHYSDKISVTFNPSFIKSFLKYEEDNSIRISLNTLKEINNQYTVNLLNYILLETSKLNNSESKKSAKFKISPNELRTKLGIVGKRYERYGDFKKRVLVPGINSINELDYKVDFSEIMEGKKVVSIEFRLQD